MSGLGDAERLRSMPVGRIGDRFELLEEAGTGGMGTVYRARDHTTGGLVALKVLAPTEAACVERFMREREILEDLSHPAIVGYVASGATEDDEPYLAMQWLEGESLSERLSRGRLSWREAAELAKRVLGALGAAHARGVIHRDLKPSNLFLVDKDVARVVVLDFGIARLKTPNRGLTETGMVVGTPGYMAPEQARGKKNVDERADLFALGCVIYRALAGREAFDGEDVLAILSKLAFEDPPRLIEENRDVPPALDGLVFDMLAKEPADRPESAKVVEDALERILGGETELVKTRRDRAPRTGAIARESLPTPAIVTPRKKRWPLVLGIVVLVPLIAVGVLALFVPFGTGTEPAEQVVARQGSRPPVCLEWADALVEAQRPDGAFGIERHREALAWTTGQMSFSLARAHRACGAPSRAPLTRGAEALAAYRAARWSERAEHPQTPSVAWSALGLHELSRELGDPALEALAIEARDLMLTGQRDDGGFLYFSDGWMEQSSNAYSTMLAAYALIVLEQAAPNDAAHEARLRACAWLRRALVEDLGDPPLRETPGLMEQTTFVLVTAHALGDETDVATLTSAARNIVRRCQLSNGRCGREIGAVGETYLWRQPGRGPDLITFWHPWATLAAKRLARVESLPADLRAQLEQIASWGEAEMAREHAGLAMIPAYQLSEYLFVASELGE